MTEIDFKNYIFSAACSLSTTAMLLLVYIKMQCREKYVFRMQCMMQAIKVKDQRTLRTAKNELIDKGLITQKRVSNGLKFEIPLLDGEENEEKKEEERDSAKNAGSPDRDSAKIVECAKNVECTKNAKEIVQFLQRDSAIFVSHDSAKNAPYKINNKGESKEEKIRGNFEQTSEQNETDTDRTNNDFSLSRNFLNEKKEVIPEDQIAPQNPIELKPISKYTDLPVIDTSTVLPPWFREEMQAC